MTNDILEGNRPGGIPRLAAHGVALVSAVEGTLADFLASQIALLPDCGRPVTRHSEERRTTDLCLSSPAMLWMSEEISGDAGVRLARRTHTL